MKPTIALLFSALMLPLLPAGLAGQAPAAAGERVQAIVKPATPLPPEAETAGVAKFSFIVYGDTRGRYDGTQIQFDHSLLVDSMLGRIRTLRSTDYPVKFVLQSGDAVVDGRVAKQWNVSYVPVINHLIGDGNVPYFLVPGNHEQVGTDAGLQNYNDAVVNLIPQPGSARRMPGGAAYAFGYGNTFVVAIDANSADDPKQFEWVKAQLEGLDHGRYTNIVVFCHQAPFSSGPHGGPTVEPPTAALRSLYVPLFNAQHVRVVFSGHEHLFEHWVEHYTDGSGAHRTDYIVSGGGGAPIYTYTGEPDLKDFLKANAAAKVTLTHLVKPGPAAADNPYHYVIVRVDGNNLSLEVVSVDWGVGFAPYKSNKTELSDGGH